MYLCPSRALGIAHRMQEMQHHAGILAHRTGYITKHHQIRIAGAWGLKCQFIHLAAAPQRGPQAARRINPPPRRSHSTARGHGFNRQAQPRQHLLGLGHLGEAHQFEIKAAQTFARGHREARVDLDLCLAIIIGPFFFAVGRLGTIQQGFGGAFLGGLSGAVFLYATDRRQHRRHHMFQIPRIAPVQTKELRKDDPVFGTVHETGVQRPVEICLVGEPRHLYRADRVNHAARAYWQARATQGTGEMGDIAGKFRIIRQL